MARHAFLIRYSCDNQPGRCRIDSDDQALSVEQARSYLQGLYRGEACSYQNVEVQWLPPENHVQSSTPGDPIEFFPGDTAPLAEC